MKQNQREDIEKALMSIVRQFISEYKTERVLSNLSIDALIENDLGVDSLGRVELFLRIEKAFSIQFEDTLMIEAKTLRDIADAIQKEHPIRKVIPTAFITPLPEIEINPASAKTLVEVLQRHAAEDPNRPHIYLQDEHGAEIIIRYGQLFESSTRVAAGLYEQGLKPGQTVAIMLPTSPAFFYAFFGILLCGGIPVPIYPPLRADRIEEYALREATILNNAGVRLLITFAKVEVLSKLLRVFIKSLNTVTTVEILLTAKGNPPRITLQPHDPALIQYTSGSTSDPKGVCLSHHNLLSNIRSFGNAIQFSQRDVAVSWLPLYHDMGLIGAWLGSLYHANPLTLLSPISFINRPERWLWAIHYHRGTVSGGPNFAYELCIRKIDDANLHGLDLSCWRLAFNGAEAINPRTLERFAKKFAPFGFKEESLYPVYGLAESSVALTFPPLHRVPKIDTILRNPFEIKQKAIPSAKTEIPYLEFVSCGLPLPLHEIKVVDDAGNSLPERQIGSLYFKGPSAMLGYYQNVAATEAIYHDGWWDTGDFAYLVDGEVFITGRKKDLIIKAGRNLYPQEIEEVVAEVTGVRKGCVIAFGVSDPKLGTEKLVIVTETAETATSVRQQMINEIIEKVSVVLAIPPDEVVLVPPRTVPKTSSGKLQRSLCKKAYLEGSLVKHGLPFSLQVAKLFIKGIFITLKQFGKKTAQYFYTFYLALIVALFSPWFYCSLILLSRHRARIFCRFFAKLLLKFTFCPLSVQGKENLPQNLPVMYISNHASYIDAILLFSVLPIDVVFTGKKELARWPLIGFAIKKLGFLTVDRLDVSQSIADSSNMTALLQEKQSLLIFPEGTFTHAIGLRPFKLGAFKIAVDTQTALCPIAIKGSRSLLQIDQLPLQWSSVTITIGKPILPKGTDWNEVTRLHNVARNEIAKHCGEFAIDLVAATPASKEPPTSKT